MAYKLVFTKSYDKDFSKIDYTDKKLILAWIEKNLLNTAEPRYYGKALKGTKKRLWRYRIGKYRMIVEIRDAELVVLCLNIATRGSIY